MLFIALFFAAIIFLITSLIKDDNKLTAIVITFYGFLFFTYGRIMDILIEFPISGIQIGRNRNLLPFYTLIIIAGTLWIFRSEWCRKNLKAITYYFNMLSFVLVMIAVLTAATNFDWIKLRSKEKVDPKNNSIYNAVPKVSQNKKNSLRPNVYFLIFDSYTSHRVLNEYYSWNDSSVVDALLTRGFSINNNARSNYCYTGASILSTLSMRYLHLDQGFIDSYNQDNYIGQYYKNNRVMDRFKSLGYDIVTNLGNHGWPQNNSKESLISEDFVQLIIHISLLRIIENQLITDQLRQDILSMLIGIKQFDKPQKPTFMCLHFMIPHSPFIFQADGSRPKYFESAFTKFENKVKFVEQVKFAGSQIIEIVDSIRQKDKDAIIIIQADHGFGGDEDMIYLNRNSLAASTNNREKPPSDYLDQRFGILNALSSPLELGIPEHSTPVNLFRYFFNEVFEDSYDYLPNKSYFALIKQPYLFHDVTDDLNQYNNRNSE